MTSRTRLARRTLGALAALALIVAALWWTATSRDRATPRLRVSAAPAPTAASHRPRPDSDTTESPTLRHDLAPLPPAGTPLGAMLPELQRRAEAGDTRAACRLGVELLRCRNALADLPNLAEDLAPPRSDEQAPRAPEQIEGEKSRLDWFERISQVAQQCEGLDPKVLDAAPRWLRQAALAGENDAVILYADGASFPRNSNFGAFADPGFDQWRREAPGMVQRALARGSPEAVYLQLVAYSGDFSLYSGLIPDDPVQHAAFTMLINRLHNHPDSGRYPNLSDAQRRVARARSERMFQDYFGNRAIPGDRRFSRALYLTFPALPNSSEGVSDHAACDPDP